MSSQETGFLITNGNVIDGTGADPFRGDVLIVGDRIVSVGPDIGTEMPSGVQVIDAAGQTVMPGMIDSHCHISFDEPSSNDELFFPPGVMG